MIFYFNGKGEPLSMISERVFQGSNRASRIYFNCPTFTSNIVSVAFGLPDGTVTPIHPMKLVSEDGLMGVFDEEGKIFNSWCFDLPSAVTANTGTVTAQFYIASQNGEMSSTASVQFFVEKGVAGVEPEHGDSYQELTDAIIDMTVKANNALDYAKAFENLNLPSKMVYKVANPNIVYGTDEDGNQVEYNVGEHMHVIEKDFESTEKDIIILRQHEYYFGTLSNATFALSGGYKVGEMIYVTFRSGEVPTELIITGNYVINEEIIPAPDSVIEICGVWNGTEWSLVWRQI